MLAERVRDFVMFCSPAESDAARTEFCAGPVHISNTQHPQCTVVSPWVVVGWWGGGGQEAGGDSDSWCSQYRTCLHCPPHVALLAGRAVPPLLQVTVVEPRPTPGFLLEVASALR